VAVDRAPSSQSDIASRTVAVREGEIVFRAGDAAGPLFVVLEGQVELVVPGEADRVVAVCAAGDVFGERSCFGGGAREVTARARTSVRAVRLDRDALASVSAEDPGVLLLLLERLSTRTVAPPAAPPADPVSVGDRPASLVVGPGGRRVDLDVQPELWVGRRDSASGFNPDVDLTDIDPERSLSRRHARIVRREGRVLVIAVPGARNGTFVNGQRLEPSGEVELADGDRVRFGLVETVFRAGSGGGPAA
jgi:hypothetical protein